MNNFNIKRILAIIFAGCVCAAVGDQVSFGINDTNKVSSRYGEIFSDTATIENIIKIWKRQIGESMYNGVSGVFRNMGAKDTVKPFHSDAKIEIDVLGYDLSFGIEYKHSKAGPALLLSNFAQQAGKVMKMTSERINEWNTTLPVLKRMREAMLKNLDSTVEVFAAPMNWWTDDRQETDERRAVERGYIGGRIVPTHVARGEDTPRARRTFNFHSGHLREWLWEKEKSEFVLSPPTVEDAPDEGTEVPRVFRPESKISAEDLSDYYVKLFTHMRDVSDPDYRKAFNDANAAGLFSFVPDNTLFNCAEALTLSYDLIKSGQEVDFMADTMIGRALKNPQRTMEDEYQIQAAIERHRHSIAVTTAELEQLLLSLEQRYARLLLRPKERRAIENEKYYDAVNKFVLP